MDSGTGNRSRYVSKCMTCLMLKLGTWGQGSKNWIWVQGHVTKICKPERRLNITIRDSFDE